MFRFVRRLTKLCVFAMMVVMGVRVTFYKTIQIMQVQRESKSFPNIMDLMITNQDDDLIITTPHYKIETDENITRTEVYGTEAEQLTYACDENYRKIGPHRNITTEILAEPGNFLKKYLTESQIFTKYIEQCNRMFHQPRQSEVKPIKFVNISYPYNVNVSKPLRLYFKNTGALGNAMFQYASVIMVARYLGRELVIRELQAKRLMGTFEMNSGHIKVQKYFADPMPTNYYFDTGGMKFTDRYYTLNSETDLNIRYCFQSYKHFQHAADEIRMLYTFTKHVQVQAQNNLDETLKKAKGKVCTVVGIHVRRGDQIKFSVLAPRRYYVEAMQYFRQWYEKVFFVVSSMEREWCQKNLQGDDWSLGPAKQPAGVDMAMLTLCDHVITSEGTYSFWVGWFSKGEVIYHNITYKWDNYLPHWEPIGPYTDSD